MTLSLPPSLPPFLPPSLPPFLPSLPPSLPLSGKCYTAVNQKSLVQVMESLTQKLYPGVVINFMKIGGASPSNPGSKDRSNTPIAMETGKNAHTYMYMYILT